MSKNQDFMCWFDEGFTIYEIHDETNWCKDCPHEQCRFCGDRKKGYR